MFVINAVFLEDYQRIMRLNERLERYRNIHTYIIERILKRAHVYKEEKRENKR